MDPLAAIKVTFFQECEEQLAELEGGLLAMEGGDHDPEIVNAVFRAVHSIKGGAGAFSLEELVRFSHVFETALDLIRSGDIPADQETLKLLLRSADVLADPRGTLSALCDAVGVPFLDAMLDWPPGRRASDGVWAPAWYDQVEKSTGFKAQAEKPAPVLPDALRRIADAAMPGYDALARYSLRAA